MTDLPPAPQAATRAFGARLDLAVRYAGLLVEVAIPRGLLGPREAERVWERHLLNCAAVATLVPQGSRLTDIGSGAGLPALPMLIARPDLSAEMVEPMQRRVAFLRECVSALGLPADVTAGRVEQLPPKSVQVLVARAVAPLPRLLALAMPVMRPGGTVLAMKGRNVADEVDAARPLLERWPGARIEVVELPADDGVVRVARVRVPAGGAGAR